MQSTVNIPEFNPCELAAIEDETTGRKEIHPVGERTSVLRMSFDPALHHRTLVNGFQKSHGPGKRLCASLAWRTFSG